MPNLRWQELLIIVALVLLLFGAKRLPDAARGLGRSLRVFKAETKGLMDDDEDTDEAAATKPVASEPSALESADRQAADPAPEPSEKTDRSRSDG